MRDVVDISVCVWDKLSSINVFIMETTKEEKDYG